MAGPKENSEFCFPKTLNVAEGNIEGLSVLLYLKNRTNYIWVSPCNLITKFFYKSQLCHGFKVHDLIMCESKVQVAVSLAS